jgi:hypothetical protein
VCVAHRIIVARAVISLVGPGGGAPSSSSSSVVVLDKKLLPRIHSYLDSLDPAVSNITPASIVDHLRRTYAEYGRKAVKGFTRTVEALCEKMRREAVEAEEAESGTMTDVHAASHAEQGANDVVIVSSLTPTGVGAAAGVSFATAASSPSASASTGSGVSPASREKKRRKTGDPSDGVGAISVSSGSGSDEESEEEADVIDLEFVEAPDRNLVNSSMRNLYNRATSLSAGTTAEDQPASASAPAPYVANPQKPRERKSKEKVVYTQNSKKPQSAKKKANRAVTNVHFNQTSAGPDDAPGEGGNWHPEVLHPTSSYADLGGIEGILQEIHELVEYPLTHPEIYRHLGIQPPRGVLLHGPPGCGQWMEQARDR